MGAGGGVVDADKKRLKMNKRENGYKLIYLYQLFDNGNRYFKVPSYQRGYSWEKEQREDLMKDIEYVIEGNYTHYTGTIVGTPSRNSKTSNTFDIVDGQQRLTTLVLLLSVIYHNYQDEEFPNKSIAGIFENYIVSNSNSGNSLRKFELQLEHDNLFYDLILNKQVSRNPRTKSEQNLIDAVIEFKKWIKKNKEIIPQIEKAVTNKLGFLFYTPENSKEIGIMFEVINNRGKELSELEKVKNYLIYFADKNNKSDLRHNVEQKWGNILVNLNEIGHHSNQQENSFLRNCWIVFEDTNKSKSHYVYDNLKERFNVGNPEKWKRLFSFVDFLDEASLTYKKLYTREDIKNEEEKEVLLLIALQPQIASVLPLLISLYATCPETEERVKQLKLIEKLNFRYYVLNVANRSDSGQGQIFAMAYNLFNNENYNLNNFYETMILFIKHRVPDNKFIQYLTLDKDEPYDYIHWQGLKYFLANYEHNLKEKGKETADMIRILASRNKKSPNDFFHREHIFAVKDFTVINDVDERDINKRRLGNFILLKETQNIKVSKNRPENKIKLYWEDRENEPNTLMIRELKNIFQKAQKEIDSKRTKKTWKYWYELYQLFFDRREQKLIEFALSRWRVDELPKDNKIYNFSINSFTDKNEVYTY